MASPTEHDEVELCPNLAPDAPAAMMVTATRTATTTADQTRELEVEEEEELTEPKLSYNWTYWHARFTELNNYVCTAALPPPFLALVPSSLF
jgi:hypothetical protein